MTESVKQDSKFKKRLKRRLLPCILAGFSLPFTLFLYGPFDLFAQNRSEFKFTLFDFLLPCILLTVICGIILAVIPLFLKKKIYSVYLAVLFWASVMLFIQGNYLNFGLTSLAGDGFSSAPPIWMLVLNTAIWLITLAAVVTCVLLFKPVRKKLRVVVSLGLCLVLVMQSVGVVAVSFNDKIFDTKQKVVNDINSMQKQALTNANLTTLAHSRNVVVFVIDVFDVAYANYVIEEYPDVVEQLDGFINYDNYVTWYQRTYPGSSSLFTGVRNDFSRSKADYFEYAYSQSPALLYMHENGYDVNIYTDQYYSYDDASVMEEYVDNISGYSGYTISDKPKLITSLLSLSLYRYLPFVLKATVDNISSDVFSSLVKYETTSNQDVYELDNRTLFNELNSEDFSLTDQEKRLNMIHFAGCHWPANYDADWNDLPEPDNSFRNLTTQSFKIITRYISQMKELGVYEDATIIITGDHSIFWYDYGDLDDERVTGMFIKPSGASGTELVKSSAPISEADVWPTIFDSEGLVDAPEMEGISFFDVKEDDTRERYYYFNSLLDEYDEEIKYRIIGDANDFSNWEIVDRRKIAKIYD